MESTQSSVTHLSALDTHLAHPTVGGKLATQVHRPESDRELASLLGEANREGMAVVPLGGGTHLGIGNAPSRLDWVVSTRNLDRVIAYEPPDMTLSVEAGATLGEVQERLAEHGQGLPIEVANPAEATIGGILATALYGPKRLGSGTLRDYLIGVNVAYAGGTLAKAGGMVVKNVSGFDLMRMHHGALGTLGVIVSANFKVLPNPRSERTVLIAASDFDEVTRLRSVIASSRSRPASFEIIRRAGAFDVAVRIQGRDRTAGLLASELGGMCGGEARIQEPGESHQFWSEYLAGFQSSEAVTTCWLRLRVKPAETLRALADVLLALEERSAADAQVSASPGLGFVDVRQHLGSAEDLRDLTGRLRTLAPKTVVISAPTDLKADIDVWGESIESLDLMRILKTEFDPSGILNPGRFVGGL
jgi:glycolate oxidase FAD binding subunit